VDDQIDGQSCPFCAILKGEEPGTIIARDDERQFALIQSIHPEATVHWMAVPFEHVESTERLEHENQERFLGLVEFAVSHVKRSVELYPQLQRGFSVKMHFGSFETISHAKLHILSTE
jgi:diadenosine tetraphosphate (Ap4A) HIT family hydrolase